MALLNFSDWSPGGLGLVALVVWACYFFISSFASWYRLRHIPGPPLAAFSYLWIARVAKSGKQFWVYRDMYKKYGPLIRVGPNELSTDDPEVIKKIAGARSTYARDPWYVAARFDPYHDNVFTMLEAGTHDRFKAKIAGAYGGRETPALEPGINDQIRALQALIRRKYLSDEATGQYHPVEFAELVSYYTVDVITRSAFGEEFGCLNTDTDVHGFLAAVKESWASLAMALDVPYIRNIFFSPVFLKFFGPRPTDSGGMGKLMGIAKDVVDKRFATGAKERTDMLASFINHGLDRQECETEALFMIIAGFENTASVIRTTFLYLMTCPRVYRKFKEVIRDTLREGNVSSPILQEEAKKISYLQAVLYEGMRMRPPAPGLYPKAVPPEGDVIHGKFIPGGTAIGSNPSAIMRNTALFGPDADMFRPERFEEASAEARAEMERNVELIFGYGRWMCAGKPVAFMEVNKIFFELMREFDFQLVNPMKPWDSLSYSQFIEDNMWVRISKTAEY
ncbi:BcABA1, cytochrome P450 monooxygenase [Durotheca rogersii]|uniref:BcABA1, cytochrome P450 monooxygenase n=1 Tax=Durotheca rogersii TaxID=419775 RepID=UPI00222049AD|nr:BcABA1, cytochrome P450 monooxygenase [Durotheca rogersii]KAI5861641.1 BcABA1, cytochrome P450 monooxygenase [Durotheca rogersii]